MRLAESLFAIHDSFLGEAARTVGQSFSTVPTPVLLRKREIDQQQPPALDFKCLSTWQPKSALGAVAVAGMRSPPGA
jgi:hypothetical protein